MKKQLILSFVFVFSQLLVMAQSIPQARIEGTLYEQQSLQPLPNQRFWIYVIDLDLYNLWLQDEGLSDTAGHYQYDVSIPNLQDTLYCYIWVQSCGGIYTGRGFLVTPTPSPTRTEDFNICPAWPTCEASWVYGNALGNTPVSFVNRSLPGALSWNWDFGDGGSSTQEHPTHAYAAPGTYYACLTVTGALGCTSTFCDSVRVGLPWTGPSTVDLYYGPMTPGGLIGLIAITSGVAKPARYFYNGMSTPYYTNTMRYEYPGNGTPLPCVDVEFTDSSWTRACLTIAPDPECQAEYYTLPDTSGQYSMLIVDNSYAYKISYSWDFGDGTTSTQAYPQHTYPGPGLYNLCVTITDSSGSCIRTFCDAISISNKVSTPFSIKVVDPFSPDSPPTVQVQHSEELFPNPASSSFEMQRTLALPTAVVLDLLDMQGRLIRHQDWGIVAAGEHRFKTDVQALPEGVYLVRMRAGEKLETHKLLILRR